MDPALHREMPHSSPSTIAHPSLLPFVRIDLRSALQMYSEGELASQASHIPCEELPPTIITVKERVKRINVETKWKREQNNYSERKEKNK